MFQNIIEYKWAASVYSFKHFAFLLPKMDWKKLLIAFEVMYIFRPLPLHLPFAKDVSNWPKMLFDIFRGSSYLQFIKIFNGISYSIKVQSKPNSWLHLTQS